MNYMDIVKDVNELSVVIIGYLFKYTQNTFIDISDTFQESKIIKSDYPFIIEELKEVGITGLTFDDLNDTTTAEKLAKIVMSRYIKS